MKRKTFDDILDEVSKDVAARDKRLDALSNMLFFGSKGDTIDLHFQAIIREMLTSQDPTTRCRVTCENNVIVGLFNMTKRVCIAMQNTHIERERIYKNLLQDFDKLKESIDELFHQKNE